jgi:hypothetical protein
MMKTVPRKKITQKSFYCLLAVLLFITASSFSEADGSLPPAEAHSILVNKTQNSKKHKIRLYADAGRQWLLFTVNGTAGSHYQLYIFDMDSRLVSQASIYNRETTVLNTISKGNYLFEVLMNDKQVERGRLVVK